MKNLKKSNTNLNYAKDIQLPNEEMEKIIQDSFYQTQMQKADNMDVNINHLENIFTDETYYLAMKIVPLIERKVLYLSYIENVRLNDMYRRLKLQKKDIISLWEKGIKHFKYNLSTLYKANKHKKGGNV